MMNSVGMKLLIALLITMVAARRRNRPVVILEPSSLVSTKDPQNLAKGKPLFKTEPPPVMPDQPSVLVGRSSEPEPSPVKQTIPIELRPEVSTQENPIPTEELLRMQEQASPAPNISALPQPTTLGPVAPPYTPNWESLDARPLPSWYDDAKVGIFIHWGVFSVPSFISEWFWMYWKGDPPPNEQYKKQIENFMKANYKPTFSYQDFAREFTAELYNAGRWADIIENSGARYVILTSKHHDGYTLWPSRYSPSWNSLDVGPHRDIVGEFRRAILKKKQIKFGLYHSLYEWFNPLYLGDKSSNFTRQNFVYNKILPEMEELVLCYLDPSTFDHRNCFIWWVNTYKPDVFWSDGEAEAPSRYWKSEEFLAWLYNESPVKDTVVVNDRWGTGTACKHGGTYTCEDRYNPGSLQNHKWENAMSIDKTAWGFNRISKLENYLTSQELIDQIASTISCGGNIVMNIGPSKDGTINPIFQDRLNEVGKWLKVNGEAIYRSKPWKICQNDTLTPNIWYTTDKSGDDLFIIVLRWPLSGIVELECPKMLNPLNITMVGLPNVHINATNVGSHVEIFLPDKAVAPTNWGTVFKIANFTDQSRPTSSENHD